MKDIIKITLLILVTKSELLSLLVVLAAAANRINVVNLLFLIYFFILNFGSVKFRAKAWKFLIWMNGFHMTALYSFMIFNPNYNFNDTFGFSED